MDGKYCSVGYNMRKRARSKMAIIHKSEGERVSERGKVHALIAFSRRRVVAWRAVAHQLRALGRRLRTCSLLVDVALHDPAHRE